jgi:hypothetical protein
VSGILDDSYHLDEDGLSVGMRRGRRYAGTGLRVQVARVDPLARTMDLVLVR